MHMIKAPNDYSLAVRPWIFIAGVIDMGSARNWQMELYDYLHTMPGTILNPRRDDWDSSWRQEKDNPQFRRQVEWELQGQEDADIISIFFDSDSAAPISLLEMGLAIGTQANLINAPEVIVCCASGFYRKGNVDITCERYDIKQVDSLPSLALELKQIILRKLEPIPEDPIKYGR